MITQFQYREMLMRIPKHPVTPTSEARAGVERERDLHDEIERYCRENQWVCVHSRMDRAATNQVGTVDFIIATSEGRTLWVEAKRKDGKLSPAQRDIVHWLNKNNQYVCVVRSLEQFVMFTRGLFKALQ